MDGSKPLITERSQARKDGECDYGEPDRTGSGTEHRDRPDNDRADEVQRYCGPDVDGRTARSDPPDLRNAINKWLLSRYPKLKPKIFNHLTDRGLTNIQILQ